MTEKHPMMRWNGRLVHLSDDGITILIPLPRDQWRPIDGGCVCDYCLDSEVSYWDTLAVSTKRSHSWTVHMPEWAHNDEPENEIEWTMRWIAPQKTPMRSSQNSSR